MTMYQLKPTPRLLTLEGLVAHGYMEQETLDAVIMRIHEIIGEDEEVPTSGPSQSYYKYEIRACNALRAQQRDRIK